MKKLLFILAGMSITPLLMVNAQNTTILNQTGTGNSAEIEYIDSDQNLAVISQIGNYNTVEGFILEQTGLNYQATQEGDENVAVLSAVIGSNNQVLIEQIGNKNSARQSFDLSDKAYETYQWGNNNRVLQGNSLSFGSGYSLIIQQGNFNVAEQIFSGFTGYVWQVGNNNLYDMLGVSGGIEITGIQLGDNNEANKLLDIPGNFISYQIGNDNSVRMGGQGGFMEVSIFQTGNGNTANQGGGYGNLLLFFGLQLGNNNSLSQSIGFVGGSLSATQLGNSNSISQTAQYGGFELSIWGTVYQQGNNNQVNALSEGTDYVYDIIQLGNRNEVNLLQQNGSEMLTEAEIGQFGNNNFADIEQLSHQQLSLTQTGNNNSAVIK